MGQASAQFHIEHINAVAQVEETDLQQLSEGMPVQITGDAFEGLALHGKIVAIGAQTMGADIYGGGGNYEVVVAIDPIEKNQKQRVRIGMSAKLVVITYRANDGIALSPQALHRGEDGRNFVVYRSNLDAPIREITVTTGRSVPQGVEVFGLNPGYVRVSRQAP